MSDSRWRFLVLNGPNLNLLGRREPSIYGAATLEEIERDCRKAALEWGVDLDFFQSNHEGALLDRIGAALGMVDMIIINPAALTHTSVGLRDALLAVGIPVIEVHLSNVYRREPFRHHSYIADIALGQIAGLGAIGYRLAIEAGIGYLDRSVAEKNMENHGYPPGKGRDRQ
ncbi:MAG: type II 3-dehydroquinate dehydratase [Magnetococcales bacterium]|nr:type II 3-dehydroquinate dehydratase [Magnetococcales bacterium]